MARKMPAWEQYSKLTRRQRNSLERKARKGDASAIKQFKQYTTSIRSATNRRLQALEKAKLDYGTAYNNLIHYLDTQFDGRNRVPTMAQIGNDFEETRWLNDYAVKFLTNNLSTVKGIETSNMHRVNKLQEDYEILPKKIIDKDSGEMRDAEYRDFEDFLRFLGSEEVATAIDEYGESDIVVDMLWEYWNKDEGLERGANTMMMKRALAQYNAGQIDFDEAMRKVGIKVEDYKHRKSDTVDIWLF